MRSAGLSRAVVGLLGLLLVASAAQAQTSVSIVLSDTNTEKGIKLLNASDTTVVSYAGKKAREATQLFFDIDDAFASKGSVTTLYATVEYYDEGTSAIELRYDAHNPALETPEEDLDDYINRNQEAARPLVRFDTKVWVQHTFALSDAYLGGREEYDADFHVDGIDGSTVAVSKITITKTAPIELTIPHASTVPKIDGLLDDPIWTAEEGQFRLCSGQQDVIQPTKWTGEKDFCSSWHFAWDNDYLYVAGDVTDDVPRCNARDPGTLFKGDDFEIYIGWDQSKPGRSSYITGSDYQFLIGLGPTPMWSIFSMGGMTHDLEMEGTPAADYVTIVDKKASDPGYPGLYFEARVPWRIFPDADGNPRKAPAPNQLMGFNVFADDGDGDGGSDPLTCDQEKAFSFTSRPSSWGNPSAWATVQILPPAAPPVTALAGDMDGNKSINIQDVLLALRAVVGQITPTDAQKTAMDVNSDGKRDIRDVILLLQKVAGLVK